MTVYIITVIISLVVCILIYFLSKHCIDNMTEKTVDWYLSVVFLIIIGCFIPILNVILTITYILCVITNLVSGWWIIKYDKNSVIKKFFDKKI